MLFPRPATAEEAITGLFAGVRQIFVDGLDGSARSAQTEPADRSFSDEQWLARLRAREGQRHRP